MKSIKIYMASLLLTLSLVGCNSLFEDAPMDKISDEATWTNSQLLDEYVNSWYRGMSNGFDIYVPSNSILKSISRYYMPWFGDQLTVGKTDWFNAGYGDILKGNSESITSYAGTLWSAYYTQIQYINTFLDNKGKMSDPARRRRVEGEAHFFRGYYYYMLWRRFGGVLLIDRPYDPLKDSTRFARATYQDMTDFIVREAETAADLLPVSHEPSEAGRITKGAALMLKAKAYLWASSGVFQHKDKPYLGFPGDESRAMLAKAREAYEALFALKAYKLIPISSDTQDGIKEEYRNIFITKNSEESILELQHANDGDYANKSGHRLDRDAAAPYFTGTTAAYTPTQNHVDEYGMRAGALYDPANPYENRDYRFYANILYDGCTYRNHVMDIHYTDNKAGVDLTNYGASTSASVSRTGYYMGKFVDATQEINDNDTYASKQNYIIWRFAEALLDYAEVCYRLDDASAALRAVNQIRARVHMDAFSAVTLEDIVRERRVEMAFEETTYWDMIRWGVAVEKMSGNANPLKAMRVDIRNGNKTYRVSNLNRFPGRVRVFTPRDYYYPIPWSEVRYQRIDQNPDWTEV